MRERERERERERGERERERERDERERERERERDVTEVECGTAELVPSVPLPAVTDNKVLINQNRPARLHPLLNLTLTFPCPEVT